jgi:hypothetical protein
MDIETSMNYMNLNETDESNTNDKDKFEQRFYLDNNLDSDHSYFVAKVQLNFYQIWSMFRELPRINKSGKCKYEWKFCHIKTGAVFSLYDWNNKNCLLSTKNWYIGCNINDKALVSEFLSVLCEAIECYNTYYKTAIETKTFTSDIPEVQDALREIQMTIYNNKELLKSL